MAQGADEPGTAGETGRTWAAVVVGLVLLAAWLLGHGGKALPSAPPAGRHLAAAAGDRPRQVYAAHVPLPDALPLRIDIASVGIHADLVPRGLKDGAVDPPPYDTPEVAGWYRDGPRPGSAGAAIVVGHVDTPKKAAVFYGLAAIKRGALIDVTRDDGTIAEFAVEAVEVEERAHFDAKRVYGSDGRPELRLITCGGSFDREAQEYSANVVVFAALTGSRRA